MSTDELIGKIFIEHYTGEFPPEVAAVVGHYHDATGFYKDIYVVLYSSGRLLWKSGAYCRGFFRQADKCL